jgi:hypothetical protein
MPNRAVIECQQCGKQEEIWSNRIKKKQCSCGCKYARILNIYYPTGNDLNSMAKVAGIEPMEFLRWLKENDGI